jgi:hypothetical protein
MTASLFVFQNMAKTIREEAMQDGPALSDGSRSRKAVKAKHFRKAAKNKVESHYEIILESLAEKACAGSIQHARMLFDLGGVKDELDEASKERRLGPSLGRLLLKEAAAFRKRREAERAAREAAAALAAESGGGPGQKQEAARSIEPVTALNRPSPSKDVP